MNAQAICIDAGEETEAYKDLKEQYVLVAKAGIVDGVTIDVGSSKNAFLDRIGQKDRILNMIESKVPRDIIKKWQREIEHIREVKRTDGIRWF